VRVVAFCQYGREVIVTSEGAAADVETFKRIVRLNTAGW